MGAYELYTTENKEDGQGCESKRVCNANSHTGGGGGDRDGIYM